MTGEDAAEHSDSIEGEEYTEEGGEGIIVFGSILSRRAADSRAWLRLES